MWSPLFAMSGNSLKSAFTNRVLISASKRTAAITGLEPSPVAGREVWMERLPSCGRSMDCTACTTFSVIESLYRGRACKILRKMKMRFPFHQNKVYVWHWISYLRSGSGEARYRYCQDVRGFASSPVLTRRKLDCSDALLLIYGHDYAHTAKYSFAYHLQRSSII